MADPRIGYGVVNKMDNTEFEKGVAQLERLCARAESAISRLSGVAAYTNINLSGGGMGRPTAAAAALASGGSSGQSYSMGGYGWGGVGSVQPSAPMPSPIRRARVTAAAVAPQSTAWAAPAGVSPPGSGGGFGANVPAWAMVGRAMGVLNPAAQSFGAWAGRNAANMAQSFGAWAGRNAANMAQSMQGAHPFKHMEEFGNRMSIMGFRFALVSNQLFGGIQHISDGFKNLTNTIMKAASVVGSVGGGVARGAIALGSMAYTGAAAAGQFGAQMTDRILTEHERFYAPAMTLRGVFGPQQGAAVARAGYAAADSMNMTRQDSLEAARMLAIIPAIRGSIGKDDTLQKSMYIVRALAAIDPAQGERGAAFALRELLSGNARSLQMRFEIPKNAIVEAAGVKNVTELNANPDKAFAGLYKYLQGTMPMESIRGMTYTASKQKGLWSGLAGEFWAMIGSRGRDPGELVPEGIAGTPQGGFANYALRMSDAAHKRAASWLRSDEGRNLTSRLSDVASSALDKLVEIGTSLGSKLLSGVNHLSGVGDITVQIFHNIFGILKDTKDTVSGWLSKLLDVFKGGIFDKVLQEISGGFAYLKSLASSFLQGFGGPGMVKEAGLGAPAGGSLGATAEGAGKGVAHSGGVYGLLVKGLQGLGIVPKGAGGEGNELAYALGYMGAAKATGAVDVLAGVSKMGVAAVEALGTVFQNPSMALAGLGGAYFLGSSMFGKSKKDKGGKGKSSSGGTSGGAAQQGKSGGAWDWFTNMFGTPAQAAEMPGQAPATPTGTSANNTTAPAAGNNGGRGGGHWWDFIFGTEAHAAELPPSNTPPPPPPPPENEESFFDEADRWLGPDSTIGMISNVLGMPQQALFGLLGGKDENDDGIGFGEVLKSWGVKNKGVQAGVGLLGDIVLDPMNLIGFGKPIALAAKMLSRGGKALRAGKNLKVATRFARKGMTLGKFGKSFLGASKTSKWTYQTARLLRKGGNTSGSLQDLMDDIGSGIGDMGGGFGDWLKDMWAGLQKAGPGMWDKAKKWLNGLGGLSGGGDSGGTGGEDGGEGPFTFGPGFEAPMLIHGRYGGLTKSPFLEPRREKDGSVSYIDQFDTAGPAIQDKMLYAASIIDPFKKIGMLNRMAIQQGAEKILDAQGRVIGWGIKDKRKAAYFNKQFADAEEQMSYRLKETGRWEFNSDVAFRVNEAIVRKRDSLTSRHTHSFRVPGQPVSQAGAAAIQDTKIKLKHWMDAYNRARSSGANEEQLSRLKQNADIELANLRKLEARYGSNRGHAYLRNALNPMARDSTGYTAYRVDYDAMRRDEAEIAASVEHRWSEAGVNREAVGTDFITNIHSGKKMWVGASKSTERQDGMGITDADRFATTQRWLMAHDIPNSDGSPSDLSKFRLSQIDKRYAQERAYNEWKANGAIGADINDPYSFSSKKQAIQYASKQSAASAPEQSYSDWPGRHDNTGRPLLSNMQMGTPERKHYPGIPTTDVVVNLQDQYGQPVDVVRTKARQTNTNAVVN